MSKVLVWLKPGYLGDAVMATPLLDRLAAAGADVSVLCGRAVASLLRDRTAFLRFLEAGDVKNPFGLAALARDLRREGFQAVILVNRSFRSALAARASGIPVRIGHSTEGRGFLLTRAIPYPADRFEANCYMDLGELLSLPTSTTREERVAMPSLEVTEAERQRGSELMDGAEVVVQPGARYASKQIPLDVMSEVVRDLQARGLRVAMVGGSEEALHGRLVGRELIEPVVDLIGRTDLRESMGVLANARVAIGSDTGLMHIAAALGCPTVTVFGPNPVAKWGHRYAPHHALEAPGGDMKRVDAQLILRPALSALGRAADQNDET
jgi:ADP-heptose:LPS heptosyltransferase